MKRSSLQKRVNKFGPKKFYEIDPWTKFSALDVGMLLYVMQLQQ
jgi:hypothetical protein